MLVLTRRDGEDIVVTLANGEEVRIRVVEIRKGRVSLGVDAPDMANIARETVPEKLKSK